MVVDSKMKEIYMKFRFALTIALIAFSLALPVGAQKAKKVRRP